MLKSSPFYASVPVRDMERARRFYGHTLDLGPPRQLGTGLSFPCGKGTTCLMYPSQGEGPLLGGVGWWQVEDIDAVVQWLRNRGVTFEEHDTPELQTTNGIFSAMGCRIAWFLDSEGNRVSIMQGLPH